MAIHPQPGQQARFVVGDNTDGYYESYTQSQARGEGYVQKAGTLFTGWATQLDGKRNARAGAEESVLPYGHRLRHANGVTEELAVLSGRHGIAMRISASHSASLAIETFATAGAPVTRLDDLITVGQGKHFMALAADRPFSAEGRLTIRSARPARSLTVVAAFGESAEQAAERARALIKGDPIGQERKRLHQLLTRSYLVTGDDEYDKALRWAQASANSFVVEEFGTGIWAGLPWFRDNWGRDTFIALPGTLLVSGQFDKAKAVLANFARYQNLKGPADKEYGRVPNRVSSSARNPETIIYNTVDGTPWMLREALEYIRYSGDREFARQMLQLALPYFEGAAAHYMDQRGLLMHDSADTWMDARIENKEPWSARGPYAVEIQALWYTALQTGATLAAQAGDGARAAEWSALANRVRSSFLPAFWDGRVMADRLREDGTRDTKVRPNQLMLVSIPFDDFVPPDVQAAVTRNAVSELLYPYGIASLSQNDPYFHPRHENDAYHHKDAAYHNGTVWGWNAGFTVTALDKFGYQDLAWDLSRNLGRQILGLGTLGTMSELLDALPQDDGTLKPSGTFAQSWSVAEFARNAYQDYIGFHPDLLQGTLDFTPALPAAWRQAFAVLPFGVQARVEADITQQDGRQQWRFKLAGSPARMVHFSYLQADGSRARVRFELRPGRGGILDLADGKASYNGRALKPLPLMPSQKGVIGALRFQTPKPYRPEDFPMLRGKDVLKGIIRNHQYR